MLSGIKSKIKDVQVVGGGQVKFFNITDSDYMLHIPFTDFDQDVTVVKVSFKEPVDLIETESRAISLKDLLTENKKLNLTSYKLKQLASSLDKGTNIFKDSNLAADGMNFNANIKPLDQTVNNWVIKNAEALYKTTGGIPAGHYQGNTVLSADKQTLYLFVEGTPTGPIAIKGLKNNISRIRIVGEGTMLPHEIYNKLYWSKIPGIVYIPVPKDKLDPELTVIAVLLDGPVDLYREKVGAIESNL